MFKNLIFLKGELCKTSCPLILFRTDCQTKILTPAAIKVFIYLSKNFRSDLDLLETKDEKFAGTIYPMRVNENKTVILGFGKYTPGSNKTYETNIMRLNWFQSCLNNLRDYIISKFPGKSGPILAVSLYDFPKENRNEYLKILDLLANEIKPRRIIVYK